MRLMMLHCDGLSCIDIGPPPVKLHHIASPGAEFLQLLLEKRGQGVGEAISGCVNDIL